MMRTSRCAVVGIGQTHHKKRRDDVSFAGLVREAALRALDDAEMTWADIDAVVLGKAPDLFEGVMKPELYLADALGARRQADVPRAHRRARSAAPTGIVGVAPRRVAACTSACSRSRSRSSREGNAQFALGGGTRRVASAPAARSRRSSASYIHRSRRARAHRLEGRGEGPAERAEEPVRAPARSPTSRIEKVKESPMMWDPLRFLESCPSSDGACAVVFTDEAGGNAAAPTAGRRRGSSARRCAREPSALPGPRPGAPAGRASTARDDVYAQAGITDPREQIDCAELYVPFSWYEPMWLEGHDIAGRGEGWKMVERRRHRARRLVPGEHVGRRAVVEPDRRVGPAALRRGRAAGARAWPASTRSTARRSRSPRPTARTAQYFAMWVVANSLDPCSPGPRTRMRFQTQLRGGTSWR